MITPTTSEITALRRLTAEMIDLINAEQDKPLQAGQTAFRGRCSRHKDEPFPLRATRKGAGEDISNHIQTQGNHSVELVESEFTQKDAETLDQFTNTICELVSIWAQRAAGHTLNQEKLKAFAYKEARSWITDGFTQSQYRTGWDCWNEELKCSHTLTEADFEPMAAESIVKIASFTRHN